MSGSGLNVCHGMGQYAGGNRLMAPGTDLSGHSEGKHFSQHFHLTAHIWKTEV